MGKDMGGIGGRAEGATERDGRNRGADRQEGREAENARGHKGERVREEGRV